MYTRDFAGRLLCENCWAGNHYLTTTKDGRKTGKIPNCLRGWCECLCRQLLSEAAERREKNKLWREGKLAPKWGRTVAK